MKTRSTIILMVLAAFVVGCKSGDTGAAADNTAPANTTTTPDAAKPADATKTAPDAAKPDDAAGGKLAGTWNVEDKDMPSSVVEFGDDGSLKLTGHIAGEAGKPGVDMEMDGTYKMDGDTVTLHATDAKVTSDATDDATKKQVDGMNKSAQDQIKKKPDSVNKIAWKGADDFTLTSQDANDKGKVTEFKRKS